MICRQSKWIKLAFGSPALKDLLMDACKMEEKINPEKSGKCKKKIKAMKMVSAWVKYK